VTASHNELLDLVTANVARRILDRRDEKREETTMTTDTNTSFKAMLRNNQFITAPGVFDLVLSLRVQSAVLRIATARGRGVDRCAAV
jgi:hypothetical protein